MFARVSRSVKRKISESSTLLNYSSQTVTRVHKATKQRMFDI